MRIRSITEGLSLTDLIDFNGSHSDANEGPLDILAESFRGLSVLQMSIDIKEKEVEEVLQKQPLALIWKSCRSKLKALDLALVWHPLEEDEALEFDECSELEEDEAPELEECSESDGGPLERRELEGNANIAAVIFENLVAAYEFPRLEKLTLRGWGPAGFSAELVESKFPNLLEFFIDGAVL